MNMNNNSNGYKVAKVKLHMKETITNMNEAIYNLSTINAMSLDEIELAEDEVIELVKMLNEITIAKARINNLLSEEVK